MIINNYSQLQSTAMPRRPVMQLEYPRREVRPSTPEEEKRMDDRIAAMKAMDEQREAMRATATRPKPYVHPPVKNPDAPLIVNGRKDPLGWNHRLDRVVLRQYTQQRLTLNEIAILHGRSKKFIGNRLDELHAIEHF